MPGDSDSVFDVLGVSAERVRAALNAARRLAQLCEEKRRRIVFAESCTAGLVSALLARTPGISAWHCGSLVTYRAATKTAWLSVAPQELSQHTAVSQVVAGSMAQGALTMTPEADLAASITGHLGPDAPEGFDGVAFLAVLWRERRQGFADKNPAGVSDVKARKFQLAREPRVARQWEAATAVLAFAAEELSAWG